MEKKLFKILCLFISAVIVLSSVAMAFAVPFGRKGKKIDLFSCNELVENIKNYEMNMTSIIYVQNNLGAWEEYQRIHGEENRIWTEIENVPQMLIDAIISIEDQRFYQHGGVDWKRTTGAFVNYLPFIDLYSSNQGGSTITQQLIKNITSDNDKSAARKLREIARALLMEKKLDKTTILEAYLNTISLGNGICGVQVASNYYFNKDVSQLSLVECASLAAITKNPSAYNPESKPEGNKKRRADVLYKMYQLKKISKEQYTRALNADVVIDNSQQENFEIPINNYFVDTLISDIIQDLSKKYKCSTDTASTMLYNGGYKIYATLNPEIQEEMEKVYLNQNRYFSQKARKNKNIHVQSAMTITDYEGNIVGIVGGVGEKTVNRGLNRATDAPRQPGSTMKPIGVYVQAIENGSINYSTVIEDKPMDRYYADGKKGPKEWYGHYAGNMTVKTALERSANTIPCWILRDDIGVQASYDFLKNKLGLKHLAETDKNLASLALGGCSYGITTTESAAAYAIFGNGGKYYEPTTYYKVVNVSGEIVLKPKNGEQVIKSTTATIMNNLLQNVVYGPQGTGGGISYYSRMKVFAKTGTSSESNDLWMVAGTPYYVGSVWYGFDKPEQVYYAGAAATVWRTIMTAVHKNLEKKEFVMDETVVKYTYCNNTGLRASKNCTSRGTGWYAPDTELAYCSGKHPVEGTTENTSSTASTTESSSQESTSSVTSSEASSSSGENSTTEDNTTPQNPSDSSQGDNNEDDKKPAQGEDGEDDSNSKQEQQPTAPPAGPIVPDPENDEQV